MRVRVLALAALLVPSLMPAQARRPRGVVNGGGPEVAPLGPQPEPIARAVRAQRSRVTLETYPFISRLQAPSLALGGVGTSSTGVGNGLHIDYRLSPLFSWTIDGTTSYLFSPYITETAETGFRFHPYGWETRLRPFVDARLGFEHAYNGYTLQDVGIGPAATNAAPSRYSRGFGAIAGAGADYSLTSTFALTSGLYAMRTNMVSYQTIGLSAPSESPDFRLTTYRLVLGIKYNPVRMVTALQNR